MEGTVTGSPQSRPLCISRNMGPLMVVFSFLIPVFCSGASSSTPSPQVNGTNSRALFCVPDVTLPRSCKGRTSQGSSTASVDYAVTFILYTPKYETEAKQLVPGDEESYENSGYNINEDTKIIIHGYYSSGKYFENMVFAYLTATQHNIILMDWSGLAKWCYCEHVLSNIEKIGKVLAKLIEYLVHKGTDLKRIHIIGHSLGAHIAGIGSINCNKGRVGRISALDPARPGFTEENNVDRLHKSRADVVDVIHTSAHTFGIAEAIGHYDFYPNGGQSPQPGCKGATSELCSHSRAHYLYTESITTDVGFRGIKCSSWTNYLNGVCSVQSAPTITMGARLTASSEQGIYYLKTGASCPYYVLGTNSNGFTITPSSLIIVLIVIFIVCL